MPELTADSTTDEVLGHRDLTDQRFVITGASSGLGEETARALAARGASITMAARNADKNSAAAERIRSAVPGADLELRKVDLADQASIRSFSKAMHQNHTEFAVLINNAGVMVCPFGHTSDGLEMQFGTNHVGHFLLTNLLLDMVTDRVVTVSSGAHLISDVSLEDHDYADGEYDPWMAYGRSKSANALFALELANRASDRDLLSFSVHPGMVMTELSRHITEDLMNQMVERLKARSRADAADSKAGEDSGEGSMPELRMPSQGAATQVWAAISPDLRGNNGAYLLDCHVGDGSDVAGYIQDEARAAQLWELSEQLVGEKFR